MAKRGSRPLQILVSAKLLFIVLLLVRAAYTSAALEPEAGKAMPASVPPVVAVQPKAVQVSENEAIELGKHAYRRSCVGCHGINPRDLPYTSQLMFERAVMDGTGRMPALDYKLDAHEVEMMRLYIGRCAFDAAIC